MTEFKGIAEKIGSDWRASGSITVNQGDKVLDTPFQAKMFPSLNAAIEAMQQWAFQHGASEVWIDGKLHSRAA